MLHVSTRGDYGLLFLTFLAEQEGAVSVREASDKLEIPYKYLGQIACSLQRAGFLESRVGRRGGYLLARPPQDLSLREILDTLEGRTNIRCQVGKACPSERRCLIKHFWVRVEEELGDVLEEISLADVVHVH